MATNSVANRVASFFLAILLAFTLVINSVGVAYADNGTTVRLDELSFLSTICGMFNSVYLPEDIVNSDLTTWEDVNTYSNDFKWLLKQLDMHYRVKAVELGYQYDDSTAENYVMPWIYFDGINNDAYPTIYQKFLSDGCLNFIDSMSDAEFKVIQAAFNTLMKTMYDYTYNLPPDDDPDKYNMIQLAQSIDYIPIYRLDNAAYGSLKTIKLCDLGYGYPPYGLVKQGLFTAEELGLAENVMLALHASLGGDDGISRFNYICMLGTASASGTYYNTVDFLNHRLVIGGGSVLFNGAVIAVDKSTLGWTQRKVTAYYTPGTRYDFAYKQLNGQPSTELTQTVELTYSNESITCHTSSSDDMCIISPIVEGYIFDGYTMRNWAQSIHTGTSDAWLLPGGFVNECQGIYYPPTVENMDAIIENVYWGKYDVSGDIIDNFLGVDTGSAESVPDEVPDFDYDRMEDAVAEMGQQITDSLDKLRDEMLHGGDYSDANNAQGSLDDKLNEYQEQENQLKDYANLDDFADSYWNVAILTDNAANLAAVSTYFMTLWDSFGPLVVVFTIAIALGLAFFLLKI